MTLKCQWPRKFKEPACHFPVKFENDRVVIYMHYECSAFIGVFFGGARKVIGFDLCEVTPNLQNEWDANVGARVLYKLCGASLFEYKALY